MAEPLPGSSRPPQPGDGAYLAAQGAYTSSRGPRPHPRQPREPRGTREAEARDVRAENAGRVDWAERMAARPEGGSEFAGSSRGGGGRGGRGGARGRGGHRQGERSQEGGMDQPQSQSQSQPHKDQDRREQGDRRGARGGQSRSRGQGRAPNQSVAAASRENGALNGSAVLDLDPSAPSFAPSASASNPGSSHSTTTNGVGDVTSGIKTLRLVQPASNPSIMHEATMNAALEAASAEGAGAGGIGDKDGAPRKKKNASKRGKGNKKDAGLVNGRAPEPTSSSNGGGGNGTLPSGTVPPARSSRRAAFEQQTKLTGSAVTPSAGAGAGADGSGALSSHPAVARVLLTSEEFAERDRAQAQAPTQAGGRANDRAKGQNAARTDKASERKKGEEKDDLVSRLTRGLGRRPFLECPICFNPIAPSQPTYSCLPPTSPPPAPKPSFNALASLTGGPNGSEAEEERARAKWYSACYTPFHLSCIRDWADRSLADETDKLRGEATDKVAEWRCPGCQKRRAERVGGYKCFCHRLSSPPTNPSAPHSCGEPCARPRPEGQGQGQSSTPTCQHPCPLPCHPGPCPPCQVALVVPCPSHGSSLTVKCGTHASTRASGGKGMGQRGGVAVCDEVCGRTRGCGNAGHMCQLLCHPGECAPCTESETVQCYCGAESQVATCGWNKDKEKECSGLPESGIETHWKGRYACERTCGALYDCGVHECLEKCHPHPLSALPCPTSPSLITHCACSQTPLSTLPPSIGVRKTCTDPIPTCSLTCPRSRPCGHACPKKCHTGECPPCHAEVVRPCRCGESLLVVGCEELAERTARGEGEGMCERVCKALRNCGRHECGRVCCPLAYKAKNRKKKANAHDDPLLGTAARREGEDDAHECMLTCGKLLSCGLHTCARKDHKGACGRCLQASYDELICHCGETVIYPPVACGTSINCTFPCARPPPSCGHPKTVHSCHETPICPPCPYLTVKPCACGKDQAVKNVRCSASSVTCGKACGALLDCGFHRCDKNCHRRTPGTNTTITIDATGEQIVGGSGPDAECGTCTNTCNKPKRACGHPCTAACHAPAKCPENEPCQAIVDQRCACGNLTSRTTCGATAGSNAAAGGGASRAGVQLKCNSECMVKQRNARLADALGIRNAGGAPVSPSSEAGPAGGFGSGARTPTGTATASGMGEVDWPAELREFAKSNLQWVRVVEGTLGGFVRGGKQSMVLPHMPPSKRSFVVSLAAIYRITTELVDVEPHRSVLVRRRIDTRVPSPALSAAVSAPTKSSGSFGGLANLRAPPVSGSAASSGAGAGAGASAGWVGAAVSGGTGSGAWGKSSTGSGVGGASTSTGTSKGYAQTVSAPGSGAATPRAGPSRPITPLPPAHAAQSVAQSGVSGIGQPGPAVGHSQKVVGEVGKVEDDEDWDVDA